MTLAWGVRCTLQIGLVDVTGGQLTPVRPPVREVPISMLGRTSV